MTETATTCDDMLAQIEDDSTRRKVGALTELQQTHLIRRDARDWGGSRD